MAAETETDLRQRIAELEGELAAARQSELQFRQLADNIREVLWLSSEDYRRWIYVSPAFEEIWGRPVAELGESLGAWTVHPDDRDAYLEAFKDSISRDKTEFEYRIVRPDGSIRWVRTHAFPVRNEAGEAYRVGGITEDIAARKLAEEALRESERRYRLLAENATDIIWTLDMGLKWTYCSPSVERVRGFTPAEAMAQRIDQTLRPASLELVRTTLASALADEAQGKGAPDRNWTLLLELSHKTRGSIWAEVTTSFIRDEKGNVVGIQGISRDVTERLKAEETLRLSEERFRTLIENIPLGVYRTRPSGEIEMVNSALLQMMGCSTIDDLKRRNLEAEGFDSSTPRGVFKETIEREGQVKDMESTWARMDGTAITVRESARIARGAQGEPLYYEGVVEDITERKKAEEALRAIEREREQFYRFLVHDLNKPLAAIVGLSADLSSVAELPEASRALLDRVQSASLRMRKVIAHTLEVERIRRGDLSLKMVEFNLWDPIREIVALFREKESGRQILIAGSPADGAGAAPPIRVRSDPTCVSRVIQNLVDNATKYGRACVEIDAQERPDSVVISVWNDGKPVPPEYHEKIFSEFYQMAGQMSKQAALARRDGFGIGLASVRRLLELLGGKVWVETPERGGTTFLVRLPRAVSLEQSSAGGKS